MAFETKLSPPVINSKLPAFAGNAINVPFTVSKAVGKNDFTKVAIKIKTVQTNLEKMVYETAAFYYDSSQRIYVVSFDINNYNGIKYNDNYYIKAIGEFKSNQDYYSKNNLNHFTKVEGLTKEQYNNGEYYIIHTKVFLPQVGQYYKIQIALISSTGIVGYYSTVGVAKYTAEPTVYIKDRNNNGEEVKFHTYQYTGVYSQENGDATEKVYSYCFNLYDEQNKLVATSGELIHHNEEDGAFESTDTWTVRKNLDPNVQYEIEYIVTTINGLTRDSGRYVIIECSTATPNTHAQLSAVNHYDDGYIELTLIGDKSGSIVNGRFILMRASSKDLYDSWYELTNFDLSQYDSNSNKLLCRDYTVEQGIFYRYAIRAYTPNGLFSDRQMNKEGPVQCDFEDAFLYDGERQLKIRFNPKVSSFKSTILESKTDTIGGKYPFIFRNGNVEYKEFGISGLISLLGDENNEFLSNLPATDDEVREDFGHWLTTDNIRKEREFKMLVLSWLTNGKPKIFRSPAEGNFIVRLMNTSLSPNDQLNRMLHTFNCTAYEIAEYNFDNLKEYNFAVEDYTETRTMKINQITISVKDVVTTPTEPAVYCSVSGEPFTVIHYMLKGKSDVYEVVLGFTGMYQFPESVLMETPLTSLIIPNTNKAGNAVNEYFDNVTMTYGYYDDTAYSFSVIDSINLSDQIIQLVGKGLTINLIEDLEDIRLATGAFPYIRVQPRDVVKILQVGSNFYYNNSNDQVYNLKPNLLYYIYQNNFNEANRTDYYLDGQDGIANVSKRKLIKDINYDFRMTGMKEGQVIDFNGQGVTSGRYDALTGISSLDELYAGNGLILDVIYQRREYVYIVEVSGPYFDIRVSSAKSAWLAEVAAYENLVAANASIAQLNAQKEKVDQTYETYLYWLELALEAIKEEYGVEYAI